ncbi:acetate--CoA ligase [Archangium minus]|uniref:Acetyl-coenzyme A synthetase n=1 Tax=Archangium minus TaxID=83450 RepID=A0ABY9X3X9_9BACT|nr:acetate--CoA ligase [Archangium minus]
MLFAPKEPIAAGARVKSLEEYQRLYRQSLEDPIGFWGEQAKRLDWFYPPQNVLDADMEEVDFSWYGGGKLNACHNAVDRHLQKQPDKVAIIWAANEPGKYERITYRELKHEVARVANVLKAHGVQKGDRVCIYMPMTPAVAYTMLACARIGAVHSVVFAGFSAESLRDRILDSGARIVVTANEAPRGPKAVALKSIVDQALDGLTQVETVLVSRRTGTTVPMKAGRDKFLEDEMAKHRSTCPVEWMSSEDPLFILYTSGSTGKPKGVMHSTAGYLVYASMTHEYVFDIHPDDVYFCSADVGWITGHSYLIYGPLLNGVTTVIFESTPMYPDSSRMWQVVDDLKATILYTSPTALRALIREGDEWVKKTSRKSLRILGTVGEPINPEVWRWYHDVVGEGRCDVVDTWWQTETGGILITPLPGATPCKPGSATFPFFGIEPVLVDEKGNVIEGNGVSGNLCLKRPWPGQARTIWGDHRRFRETYFSTYPGMYFTGDGCRRDEDGYYWITGRVDDVLNVSGHRLGTAEIESALVAHDVVAEAAVVGFPHDIKGTGICAYVTVKSGQDMNSEQLVGALKEQVRRIIGPLATPDRIRVVSGLPKTRSGKIMRRILRKVAEGQTDSLGDTTTLAEPQVVDEILQLEQKESSKSR